VSPIARGMYHRPLLRPSFQWGVGGDNCARPCAIVYRGVGKGRCIRTLLVVTEDDWARGDIDVIKCQFCSAIVSGFGRTSCGTVTSRRRNLLKISFCDQRGDFFACSDLFARTALQATVSFVWLGPLSVTVYTARRSRSGALRTSWFVLSS